MLQLVTTHSQVLKRFWLFNQQLKNTFQKICKGEDAQLSPKNHCKKKKKKKNTLVHSIAYIPDHFKLYLLNVLLSP